MNQWIRMLRMFFISGIILIALAQSIASRSVLGVQDGRFIVL